MSRIHRFVGSIDAPYPETPNHAYAFVCGTTPGTPVVGFVSIPLTAFPESQRAGLKDNDRIEGRYCPRSLKVKVV